MKHKLGIRRTTGIGVSVFLFIRNSVSSLLGSMFNFDRNGCFD